LSRALHIGLIVNPLAGLGGSLGLKGSDGDSLRELAAGGNCMPARAAQRVTRALQMLLPEQRRLHFTCWGGDMGESVLRELDLPAAVAGYPRAVPSSAADTRTAARTMRGAGVDIIVFAGGDGTARDICDEVGPDVPVLGIPAGVKMHSGVFAVSPEAAGELLLELARGGLVDLRMEEVRDIDEEAFRQNVVRSRFHGEMRVPAVGRFLQHTKVGGREDPALAAAEFAAWFVEQMQSKRTYLIGPGSTTAAVMGELDLPNTLLGVDAVRDGQLLASDANENTLLDILSGQPDGASIVVTVIGGQGHVFGRGNQQFSPAVIRAVGIDNLMIVAAKSKISGLEGRPLLVDTDDPDLDAQLSGLRTVYTGYDDQILYRVGMPEH